MLRRRMKPYRAGYCDGLVAALQVIRYRHDHNKDKRENMGLSVAEIGVNGLLYDAGIGFHYLEALPPPTIADLPRNLAAAEREVSDTG